MTDIRLSDQVREVQDKNLEFAREKTSKLMGVFNEILKKEFDWKYDETYWVILYCRKGNDVNTIWWDMLMSHWNISWVDLTQMKYNCEELIDQVRFN